jgi:hypothetical protein
MGVMRIYIDELVLDSVPADAAELADTINAHLAAALLERRLTAETAARVGMAVGGQVAREVNA